ncbi:MAG: hypothetical protein ACC631_02140 [Halocynthiibacter sp.]
MKNEWILDVLADLKAFAVQNNLLALAEQLDDTTMVAASDLVSAKGGGLETAAVDAGKAGKLHQSSRSGGNA